MAEARQEKKRQRTRLLKSCMDLKGTSNKTLTILLKKLQGEGISPNMMTAVRLDRWNAVKDALELKAADGEGIVTIPYANPNRLLQFTSSVSDDFRKMLEAAFVRHPCSRERPWNLLIGFDEYVPGDKLKVHNSRKAMNLIFSFEELGKSLLMLMLQKMCEIQLIVRIFDRGYMFLHHHHQHDSGELALSSEKSWLTPLVIRSDKFKTVSGGWSAILAVYLNQAREWRGLWGGFYL